LVRKDGKIVAVMLYKDKNGRKMIALGTNGSKEGKEAIKKMLKEDIKTGRSYGEVSHGVLKLIKKMFTQKEFDLYVVPSEKAISLLNKGKKGAIPIDEFSYGRMIGDEVIIKVMYGKPGQSIN